MVYVRLTLKVWVKTRIALFFFLQSKPTSENMTVTENRFHTHTHIQRTTVMKLPVPLQSQAKHNVTSVLRVSTYSVSPLDSM